MNDSNLTKRQRRLLKKQRNETERLRVVRRKKFVRIISIFAPVILIVVVIIFGLNKYSSDVNQETPKGIAKIEISPQEYNAGTVSMSDGLVEHTYEIKNAGNSVLKIDRIWTSCMCTTARLIIGNKKSPEFGMHSVPGFWNGKIPTGEIGYLKVVFDPAFHGPGGTGQAVRVIYISSNDPQNKQVEVRLFANVVQ